jgi:hypothetical protein
VVMIGAWEVLDHLVDDRAVRFGTPEWETLVGATIGEALDIAGAGNTPIAALSLPCMRQGDSSMFPALARNDPDRVAAYNRLLREQAAQRPNVHVLELSERLCPDGQYLDQVDGAPLRYDGVHLTPEGATYVMNWLEGALDALAEGDQPDVAAGSSGSVTWRASDDDPVPN